MELKDFKDVIRVMTKEEFESAINEDIKFVERFKHFFKHDDEASLFVLNVPLLNIVREAKWW